MSNFCRNCGSELEPNATYCANCGTKVEGNNNSNSQNDNTYQVKKVTNRNIALAIILSIITCGLYNLYWKFIYINILYSKTVIIAFINKVLTHPNYSHYLLIKQRNASFYHITIRYWGIFKTVSFMSARSDRLHGCRSLLR